MPDLDTVVSIVTTFALVMVWPLIAIGKLWILNRNARAWMKVAFTPDELARLDDWDIIPIRMGIPMEMPLLDDLTNIVDLDEWREAAE